jgi:transposase
MEGLWELPGRGRKPRWSEEDIVFLEKCLKEEPRTYNSSLLAQKLEREHNIHLGSDRLRRVLKKRGSFGNSLRKSHKGKQYPVVQKIKQTDLDMLELAAAGEIDLKYLDESGFCAWSEPGYTYYQLS